MEEVAGGRWVGAEEKGRGGCEGGGVGAVECCQYERTDRESAKPLAWREG